MGNKGQIPWNKNKTGIYSEETLKKIRETSKGRISWCKGKKIPYKPRPKALGRIAWNKGKTQQTDSRIIQPWLGKKRPDIGEKIRKRLLRKSSPRKGIPSGFGGEKSCHWKGGKPRCPICQKEISYKAKYCKQHRPITLEMRIKKQIVAPKREKCHLWRGGITPQNHKIRTSLEIKLWRKAIFIRDDFTCQKTKIKGGKLIAHHINNFADFPELRTSIENGIVLSKESHKEFHKIYGIRNNTREQLNEFLNLANQ